MYVRREVKHGRKMRGHDFSLFIGRFRSTDDAKRARVVRWNYGLDEDDKAGLIQFLIETKPSKKRGISEVSPTCATESRPLQPLVELQPRSANIPVTTQPIEKPPASGTIHFVLEGRGGKMALPDNGLLSGR